MIVKWQIFCSIILTLILGLAYRFADKFIHVDVFNCMQNDILFRGLHENVTNLTRFNQTQPKLDLYIDILICTDYSIYMKYKKILSENSSAEDATLVQHIKAYYLKIMQDVNRRFEASFENDQELSIRINDVNFYIATTAIESPWSELSHEMDLVYNQNNNRIINAEVTLSDFNYWLEVKRDKLPKFDHAFAVTSYDLRSIDEKAGKDDYNGLGYVSGICKKFFSGSLIEDFGAYTSTRSFAHELCHNLGSIHDEETIECKDWDNFLMASNFHSYNRHNSWILSKCSVKMIKEFLIVDQNHNCLMDKTSKSDIKSAKYSDKILLNSTEQCQQLFGPNSIPCFEYAPLFCETLYCRKSSLTEECQWIAPAADETICDEAKWCQQGKCIGK